MGSLFRSEPMQYVRLTIPREAAHDTLRELGEHGKYHLVDLMEHAAAQTDHFLHHKKRVIECAFWERKFERFEEMMKDYNIPLPTADPIHIETKHDLLAECKAFVEPLEMDLNRNIEFKAAEERTINQLNERLIVLRTLKGRLKMSAEDIPANQEVDSSASSSSHPSGHMEMSDFNKSDFKQPLLGDSDSYSSSTHDDEKDDIRYAGTKFHNYVTGTIPVASQGLFERMLYRVSRGNAYVRYISLDEELMDPATGEPLQKAVFYVVYLGKTLATKIDKICDFFRANRYEVPELSEEFDRAAGQTYDMITEKKDVVLQTSSVISRSLQKLAHNDAHSSPLRDWQDALRKERAICDALRQCQAPNNSQIIISEGWVPVENLNELQQKLDDAVRSSHSQPAFLQVVDTKKAPPTYFKNGKFTRVFQGIVNTYGVPRYQEVNPGLFTIITFPFLFGVMYGDIGHATLLTIASLLMIIFEKPLNAMAKNKTLGEIPTMAFNGRYLLVLMGFFSVYCGTIYNDCFSIPTNVFGSKWHWLNTTAGSYATNVDPVTGDTSVYPYGVDPIWYSAKNELTFFNSLKMKISVTLGVVQMTFGICLGLFNHLYFGHTLSIFFEFLPQLLFMLCTFGYMIFIIIYKWTVDWYSLGWSPPNLIQTMISMFLSPGSVASDKKLYGNQGVVQAILLLVAVFSVPMMLCVKPCVENSRHKKKKALEAAKSAVSYDQLEDRPEASIQIDDEKSQSGHDHSGGHGDGHEEFDFSEVFIHQCIHTIEFVLGCVSNTASYLRLWALSLAHAELSSVFWEKLIMQYGVNSGMSFMSFVGWGAWAGATFAVLMCMDVLECFLHALRLHWVEFQNKFFHADGYAFAPFNFEQKQED